MPIRYVLLKNALSDDPDDYAARVISYDSVGLEEVIERMVQQGSTVTRADIVSVLEDFYTAIEGLLLNGVNVNTPLANFRLTIRGTFHGVGDSFDPDRHWLRVAITAGRRLRQAIRRKGRPVKDEMPPRFRPYPVTYTDLNSGERNHTLTPGGMGQIEGYRLKFDADDPLQGIFFIAEDGTETRVRVMGENWPGKLLFLIPDLAPGSYRLEVRTLYRGADDLRVGTLSDRLTVL